MIQRQTLRLFPLVAAGLTATLLSNPTFAQAPECPATLPGAARLPDLVNIVPHHVHIQEQQKRHRLMFTVGLANVGDGPLELAPTGSLEDPSVLVSADQHLYDGATAASSSIVCRRSLEDAFVFHPTHNHWHLVGINGFDVRRALDDGSGGAWDAGSAIGSVKEGFCLIDYVKMRDDQLDEFGLDLAPRTYFDCNGVHGVSLGWVDYYHHATHGQYVDVTGAPPGIYYLVVTANPDGLFIEDRYDNNRSWVSFTLRYNNSNNAIVRILFDSLGVGEGIEPPTKTNR